MKGALYSRILFAIAFGLVWTSCNREDSSTVDQDTIWAHYELFYNGNQGVTYARATFRFSNATGTKLELADGAEVRFNGDVIPWQNGLAFYEEDIAGLTDNGTFEYTDLDGNTFTNSIVMPSVAFPAGIDSIPRDEAFELFWIGTPLEANEAVAVWINGELEEDSHLFYEGDDGSESIILTADEMQDLPVGDADWVMDRTFSPLLLEGTSRGGSITARMRALNEVVFMQ